jgi:hypothetical protein
MCYNKHATEEHTMFNTLEFKTVPQTGIKQAKAQFGQYQLSVILEPWKTLYEVAVFDDDRFVQLPGIHPDYYEEFSDDVIPGLDAADVSGIMHKLETLRLANALS